MAIVKLAEALLRRKELAQKVDQLRDIKTKDVFELKMRRQPVSEGVDDVVAQVPKVDIAQVTAEHDHYAKQLRLCDAAIQQANWNTDVELAQHVMSDWFDLHPPKENAKDG